MPSSPTGKLAGKELFRPETESFFFLICLWVSSTHTKKPRDFVALAMESAFEIWVAKEGGRGIFISLESSEELRSKDKEGLAGK